MSELFTPGFDTWDAKLMAGNRMVPVIIQKRSNRLFVHFSYNEKMIAEIKSFEGAKWHGRDDPPQKIWSIADSVRNRFQIRALAYPSISDPNNPYYPYCLSVTPYQGQRKIYEHQSFLAGHILQRHYCIVAAEMGTGKTLIAIEVIEASNHPDWLWVGPKSAIVSVKLEFMKWRAKITPKFVTYEGLQKLLAEWPAGKPPPYVFFDECSRLKNPTAKRTIAARYLADSIRQEHGDKGFVVLMSGTPSPKSPLDWYSLCEIACPGFIREGTIAKFKERLAITELREQFVGGGAYQHLLSWRDDERKCNICGLFQDSETHSDNVDCFSTTPTFHKFQPSINEVAKLYGRMAGLVEVKFKKDCLDLPDKIYKEVIIKPTNSMLNAARAIEAKCSSTVQALTMLRELSDGFQYFERVEGTQICELCHGNTYIEQPKDSVDIRESIKMEKVACPNCKGKGETDRKVRDIRQVPCPKDDILREILDEHDDVGRLVVYGGFKGTIDRVVDLVAGLGNWKYIRVDGRGWASSLPYTKDIDMVHAFQSLLEEHPRVVFIGHPGSAGMGLTLTASPTIVYYSNDFNGESRIQSEDRIHRAGMDTNRGATIVDLIHLPTDKVVLENLKKKKDLQAMTMGQLKAETERLEPALSVAQVLARL